MKMNCYGTRIFSCFLAMSASILVVNGAATSDAYAQATIFEVIHPDVEEGEIELEVHNGVALNSVEEGEERSVHEFAIGYGLTDNWKITGALELANPQGEDLEVENYVFENLLLLSTFGGSAQEGDGEDDSQDEFTLGFYTELEIPDEGGFSEGKVEFGPVFDAKFGELEFVGNIFAEIPFEGDEDAGLTYASQLVLPVNEEFSVGVESFGEFEGLFGDRGHDHVYAGPALYWEAELPNGNIFEPRVAVLFGLNDESADAVLSFDLVYKIGQE